MTSTPRKPPPPPTNGGSQAPTLPEHEFGATFSLNSSAHSSPSAESSSTVAGPSSLSRRQHSPLYTSITPRDHEGGYEGGRSRGTETPSHSPRSRRSRPSSPRSKSSPTPIPQALGQKSKSPRNFSRPLTSPMSHDDPTRLRTASSSSFASHASRRSTSPIPSPDGVPRLSSRAPPKADVGGASTSQMYPGVVLGSYPTSASDASFGDGIRFDGSMDDILDPSAPQSAFVMNKQGSDAGQTGATIAPWLKDDTGATKAAPSGPTEKPVDDDLLVAARKGDTMREKDSRKHSMQILNHFSSVPALPKIKRHGTDYAVPPLPNPAANRSGSQPQLPHRPSSSGTGTESSRSRLGSQESVQTLSAPHGRKGKHSASPSHDGTPPRTGADRVSRLSTASTASGSTSQADRKKGLFSGFMRRRTGQSGSSSLEPGTELESGKHRRLPSSSSKGGDTPRMSESEAPGRPGIEKRQPSFAPDGSVSPLHEADEPDFRLDLNLEDMEGIVDPTLANVPPSAYRFPPPASTSSTQTATTTTTTSSGSMFLQDALHQTSSVATSHSDSTSSTGSKSGPQGGRSVVSEASRTSDPFQRTNPFRAGSSVGSEDRPLGPPSPHTMSPKNPNQPRRPSQLRNVKMSSLASDSSSSDATDNRSLQPIAPAWANPGASGQTVFHDPFGAPGATAYNDVTTGTTSPSRSDGRTRQSSSAVSTDPSTSGPSEVNPDNTQRPSTVPSAGQAAAWAAPESWGVEGDAQPDDEASSDEWSGPADDLSAGTYSPSSPPMAEGSPLLPSPSAELRKPPPFGYNSPAKIGQRPPSSRPGTSRPRTKNGSVRPGTATRPGTGGRPGTSGSVHASNLPHWIRIYRADGSHSVLSFPLMTTTADIINFLSGASELSTGKKVSRSMRLYVRERGQDRQLLSSEKPLAIQDRRLRQAGFTEAEHIEELGKQDFCMLCKFIYQTPVLPVMDPEEESAYDSFEFIDIAGRDLQTIPIFLHLHAHNIIILNVSRNPMTDLPLDFIQACSSLKELHMSYMALKRIPLAICSSATLTRLDVSCNRIADLENVPLHEIATLTSLKVQNNKLTSIPSYFAQMKKLKYLNISNNKFETFPPVLCSMSNLVDLDVSFNTIAEFPAQMSDLKSLERLAAFGNELKTFPSSFSTMASLRVLDVRRNKLNDLTAVYALPNLSTLQADNNDLVTLDAQLGVRVREFSVPHNPITRFTLASPHVSTLSLTHLNLSHGKISTLADEALHGLVNLVELNLDFNQFTRLPSTLSRLINLESFSCTDNLLDVLPVGFGRMQSLRTLNVHNNNLKELPGELFACSSLESVNASSNLMTGVGAMPSLEEMMKLIDGHDERKQSITSEDKSTLIAPPASLSLRQILLADNRFTEDIFHNVAQLTELRTLNLSFNDIFEIPPATLSKLTKLEALYLSGNKLTSLPAEDLEKLTTLRVLHLNGNKLKTLPSELGSLLALQHLDVGSNVLKYNIANWPYDWNWNWNTALRYLNLSGNKRLEIKPTSAHDMPHSTSRKELSDFNALTELRILGLMDVTLRIPSLPDESDEQRVRTSFSDINNMAYGIADMLGSTENLAMFDLVVPRFRGNPNECLFGMFGRDAPSAPAGKIPKFLQDNFSTALISQIEQLQPGEEVGQALRRAFLWSNRATFDHLSAQSNLDRKGSIASYASGNTMTKTYLPGSSSFFRTGSSGAVVYLVDKTLNVANVGDCLVVLSRKGEAELLSKLHDPTDREETARIRRAEAWVSTKGFVNDEKDVDISRAVGYYQTFPAINASPEVRTRQLTETDEFVIIGNHALWKWCSYQTAVDIARTERDDPMMAAQKLRDFAISYGADGSLMVMVVTVSDLFFGRTGQRPTSLPTHMDADGQLSKRSGRRRIEEVGDRTLNRLQQEIEPPQGQVAIVFTDIVNSTSLWETNQGMPTAIKMHHNLMRRQLRLDGGYEVKTEGDSFMVSFQNIAAALAWAFNCQIGLLSQEWPRELLESKDGKVGYDSEGNLIQRGLRVRMGIHWGAPQCERDPITGRMDYYGPMVNRAARINASADGGQLMASQDVINEIQNLREYLDGHAVDVPMEMKREIQELRRIGFEVQDMGERKLKGLEVPEKLHLLYPKSLSGRFELSNDLRANVEVGDARPQFPIRYIDIEHVRSLAKVAIRLEGICSFYKLATYDNNTPPTSPRSPLSPLPASPLSPHNSAPITTFGPTTPGGTVTSTDGHAPVGSPLSSRSVSRPTALPIPMSMPMPMPVEMALSPKTAPIPLPISPLSPSAPLGPSGSSSSSAGTIGGAGAGASVPIPMTSLSTGVIPSRRTRVLRNPISSVVDVSLGPSIRDDMGDEELMIVMDSLTTRIENSLSSIYLAKMGLGPL